MSNTFRREDLNYLETFGFVVLRGYFAAEIDEISAEFDRLMAQESGRLDTDGQVIRSFRWQMLDASPRLAPLIDSPQVCSAFDAILGTDWQYWGSMGNHYAGNTGWHTDDYSSPRKVKISLYLDPTGPGAGGLSVIPLSHRISEDILDLQLSIGMSVKTLGKRHRDIPCVTLATEPGDAVVFDHNLLHSSWDGGDRRRMLSINAHQRYRDPEQLRENVLRLARFLSSDAYGPYMVGGDAPASRRPHLEQILALEDELRQAVAEATSRGGEKSKESLPDMSDNTDPARAIDEFRRDTDYLRTVNELRGAVPRT